MNATAQPSPARTLITLLGVAVGAAGFTASLTGTYLGMRDFMFSGTGFCASGGPYEIASECPDGVIVTGASMFGLLVFWGVFAGVTAWAKGPVLGSSLFMWGALFGLLGWNFIDLGIFNSPTEGTVWGWAASGVVFWIMALGGLVPAALLAIKSRNGPDEPTQLWDAPLVRAAVQTSPTAPAPSGHRGTAPARLVIPPEGRDA